MNEPRFTLLLLLLIIAIAIPYAFAVELVHPFLPHSWMKVVDESPYLFPLIIFVSAIAIIFSFAGIIIGAMDHNTKPGKKK